MEPKRFDLTPVLKMNTTVSEAFHILDRTLLTRWDRRGVWLPLLASERCSTSFLS